jgi:hypothetical protein
MACHGVFGILNIFRLVWFPFEHSDFITVKGQRTYEVLTLTARKFGER